MEQKFTNQPQNQSNTMLYIVLACSAIFLLTLFFKVHSSPDVNCDDNYQVTEEEISTTIEFDSDSDDEVSASPMTSLTEEERVKLAEEEESRKRENKQLEEEIKNNLSSDLASYRVAKRRYLNNRYQSGQGYYDYCKEEYSRLHQHLSIYQYLMTPEQKEEFRRIKNTVED